MSGYLRITGADFEYTVPLLPHPNYNGGVYGFLTMPNGRFLSIIGGGEKLLGDGIDTFEVAVCDSDGELVGDSTHVFSTADEIATIVARECYHQSNFSKGV